jgi:hypothetical protein
MARRLNRRLPALRETLEPALGDLVVTILLMHNCNRVNIVKHVAFDINIFVFLFGYEISKL